jgi:flagellar basal body-associated protein FliL
MAWAALILWVVTALGGFVLLTTWLRHGGMQQADRPGRRIRPPLILGHFALAAVGLVLWIAYVATDSDALAWIAFALLLVVALLGFTMFAAWLAQRGGATAAETADAAERHFPQAVVGLHGLLAATTLVLVFLAAVGVGD